MMEKDGETFTDLADLKYLKELRERYYFLTSGIAST